MFFCLFERICGQAGESFFLFTLLNRAVYGFPSAIKPDLFSIPIWGQVLFRACGPSFPTLVPIRHPRERGDPGTREREKQKENRGETQSTRSPRTWVPACAGMTESAIVFGTQGEKLTKIYPQILSRNLYSVPPRVDRENGIAQRRRDAESRFFGHRRHRSHVRLFFGNGVSLDDFSHKKHKKHKNRAPLQELLIVEPTFPIFGFSHRREGGFEVAWASRP